jgi:hypothetical protein
MKGQMETTESTYRPNIVTDGLHIIDNTTGEDQACVTHTHVPKRPNSLPVEVRAARNSQ